MESVARENTYSTGCSTVRIRRPPSRFKSSTIMASVVVLPEPVGPVTTTSPSRRNANRSPKLRRELRPGERGDLRAVSTANTPPGCRPRGKHSPETSPTCRSSSSTKEKSKSVWASKEFSSSARTNPPEHRRGFFSVEAALRPIDQACRAPGAPADSPAPNANPTPPFHRLPHPFAEPGLRFGRWLTGFAHLGWVFQNETPSLYHTKFLPFATVSRRTRGRRSESHRIRKLSLRRRRYRTKPRVAKRTLGEERPQFIFYAAGVIQPFGITPSA